MKKVILGFLFIVVSVLSYVLCVIVIPIDLLYIFGGGEPEDTIAAKISKLKNKFLDTHA